MKHWIWRSIVAALALALAGSLHSASTDGLPLMPCPQKLERLEGHFILDADMAIHFGSQGTEQALAAAIERFADRLERQTGTRLADLEPGDQRKSLNISVEELIEPFQRMSQMTPNQESYRLRIDRHGIDLHAQTQFGIYHGLETILQLFGTKEATQVSVPAVSIVDEPRFPWRGLLLDSSRHFFSVETVKRQIDGMAAAKLNVFHWHLTDDQGWRLESRAYPKLHEKASGGQYYTRDEVREVVAYAAERGIQVMPEIDMPGHSTAIGVAYPELMSQPGPYELEERWGVHRPLLNPAEDAVYDFARTILAEVAELFPFDYVHIGGDEVDPRDWEENPDIQAFRKSRGLADSDALHAYFNQRISDILAELDRKMIGWDEVLHPDLPRHTAVQSWRGADSLGQAARVGHPAILSTGFYLDQPQPAGYHYRNRFFAQPLAGRDQVARDESWEIWQFELPRKRGSAITGKLTLIEAGQEQGRGFIDFDGRSRQMMDNLRVEAGYVWFELDTWMGPVRARLTLEDDQLGGDMIVGNAPYRAYGERVAHSGEDSAQPPEGKEPVVLDEVSRQRVLGGEIALWSEIINEDSIDRRLWPRAFAVAERLWSNSEQRDEDAMYRRLQAVSAWSEASVGLQHYEQMHRGIARVTTAEQYPLARVLAEAVEPAQYYHRHHEKSTYESYSRRDPLDRFVDALPSESFALRDWQDTLNQWLQEPEENARFEKLYGDLQRWEHHSLRLLEKIEEQGDPGSLATLAERVRTTAAWGRLMLENHVQGETVSASLLHRARAELHQAQQIEEEVVVALAYPVEQLVNQQLLLQAQAQSDGNESY
ncbi:beta-N-acetylhexosaminidase [Wenzhouxiangella sp. AB-CW3]|uniref:beta-N-acetylhexosaminidase n=1 Tax=Wenzhouxiangella sp. AB-CW3 TaxID=2771012 RepID=UPI00168ADFD3|nr:family 20 glycosylhydrolase [Wenzhouxiangella sp. AB-CW3]QOC21790.1 beta-N-acetylhexosaminidase [Wenzhouxiangella sp. AB-CW3]